MVSDLASSPVLGPFEAIWGPGKKRGRPPVVRYWSDTVPRRGPDALVPNNNNNNHYCKPAQCRTGTPPHIARHMRHA